MGLQSPYPCEGRCSVIRPPLQTQTSQRSDLPSAVMQDGLDGSLSEQTTGACEMLEHKAPNLGMQAP